MVCRQVISDMRSTRNDDLTTDTEDALTSDENVDTEAILKLTRAPKTPPAFIPRSRSLDDLPGGIRVPIVKRPESRVSNRLQALQDGLEELEMLRHKQTLLINSAKSHLVGKNKLTNTTLGQCRRFSTSCLASIREEIATDSSIDLNKSYPETSAVIDGLSCKRSASITKSQNTTVNVRGNQDTSINFSKLRRPSFQSESIITKNFRQQIPHLIQNVDSQIPHLIQNVDSQSPSPLRAVMRQYEVVLQSAAVARNTVKRVSPDKTVHKNPVSPLHQNIRNPAPSHNQKSESLENVTTIKFLTAKNSNLCNRPISGSMETVLSTQSYPETTSATRRSSLPASSRKSPRVTNIDEYSLKLGLFGDIPSVNDGAMKRNELQSANTESSSVSSPSSLDTTMESTVSSFDTDDVFNTITNDQKHIDNSAKFSQKSASTHTLRLETSL